MAQAFLLKTDAAVTSNIASQKQVKNQASHTDEKATESFSSALDKQVIKQDKKPSYSENEDKTAKLGDDADAETEISGEKSGKALPDDDTVAETGENQEGMDEEEATATTSIPFSVHTEAEVEHKSVLTVDGTKKSAVDTTKAQAAEASKLAGDALLADNADADLSDQKSETSEQKQSLRSDILNALLKKPTAGSEKFAKSTSETDKITLTAEQKIVANASLTSINKDGLTEEQKIIALANNLKLKGSLSTGTTAERGTSVSSVLLTPASSLTSSNALGATTASGQPTLNLQPSLQSEAWSRVLSSRVIWMAREGVQQASLKLNPANMGPVEVKLHMHNEQANISFIAQHAATRDALEQALPRLRESFQENGMELAHADVSQENFSQTDEQENKTTNNGSTSERESADTVNESTHHDATVLEQDSALGLSVFA